MAVTVASNVRGWREVSSTAFWTARVTWDTGSAIYKVLQDTGASPKVRVFKGNAYPNPTAYTEQDSADNKTITNVNYPYSSWLHTNGDLHIAVFTATNTITHYIFDTDTDQWGTGHGDATTVASNERPIRVVVRSDGDVLIAYTNSTDDADIGLTRWEGASWTAIVWRNATSTEAGTIGDLVIDSVDISTSPWYDVTSDDFEWVSYLSTNGTNQADIDADVQASETGHSAGARFNIYDDAGTDKIIAAYIESNGTLRESVLTLEQGATAGGIAATVEVEGTAASVGARTPLSTAVIAGTPYCAWWDDANSGTIKYSTKTAGSWAAETDFATGITRLIEIVPVDNNQYLMVVYQSGNDVVMDWFIAPPAGENLTAEFSAAGTLTTALASAVDRPAALAIVITSTSAFASAVDRPAAFTAASISTASFDADVVKSGALAADGTSTAAFATVVDHVASLAIASSSTAQLATAVDRPAALAVNALSSATFAATVEHVAALTANGASTATFDASATKPAALAADSLSTASFASAIDRPAALVADGTSTASLAAVVDHVAALAADAVSTATFAATAGAEVTADLAADSVSTAAFAATVDHVAALTTYGLEASQETYSTSSAPFFGSSSINNTAQQIQFSDQITVQRIALPMGKNPSAMDSVVLEVRPDNGGEPSATVIATSLPLSAADIPDIINFDYSTLDWRTFTFPEGVVLGAAIAYWIVLARTGALNNQVYSVGQSPGESYASGNAMLYNGSAWSTYVPAERDLAFRVYADGPASTAAFSASVAVSAALAADGVSTAAFDAQTEGQVTVELAADAVSTASFAATVDHVAALAADGQSTASFAATTGGEETAELAADGVSSASFAAAVARPVAFSAAGTSSATMFAVIDRYGTLTVAGTSTAAFGAAVARPAAWAANGVSTAALDGTLGASVPDNATIYVIRQRSQVYTVPHGDDEHVIRQRDPSYTITRD